MAATYSSVCGRCFLPHTAMLPSNRSSPSSSDLVPTDEVSKPKSESQNHKSEGGEGGGGQGGSGHMKVAEEKLIDVISG